MRLFGHRPSPRHRVGLGHPEHLAGITPLDVVDNPMPPVWTQAWQDCPAHAIGGAVWAKTVKVVAAARGISFDSAVTLVEPMSRRWSYRLMRALAGELGLDKGGYIYLGFDALADKGFPPESKWQYVTDDPVARDADWDTVDVNVDRCAKDQKWVVGAQRIMSVGDDLVRDVAAALTTGDYVVGGWDIDQVFCDLRRGQVWPGVRGKIVGGHAMVVRATAPLTTSRRKFRVRSSWGQDFADDGDGWMAEEAIKDNASDLWIVRMTPEWSGTA